MDSNWETYRESGRLAQAVTATATPDTASTLVDTPVTISVLENDGSSVDPNFLDLGPGFIDSERFQQACESMLGL